MLKLDMNLVWTVINVIILFLLIKKFLFKPVNNILEKRQQEAEDVLLEATAKQKEADNLKKQYDDSLKQLELDKEKSLEEAHNKASQEYDRIVSEADKKAGEKLEDAKAAAEKEHSQMIADAKDEIAGMVIEASDKMTASKADPETDHALFEKFISETKKKSQ